MPYPENCPECGGAFRNTGTHFTARRNEVGRHVLLELGCQNTTRRFWWDFTTGAPTEDGRASPARRANLTTNVSAISASNGSLHVGTNGHLAVSTLDPPEDRMEATNGFDHHQVEIAKAAIEAPAHRPADPEPVRAAAAAGTTDTAAGPSVELPGPTPEGTPTLKAAFIRQLQLDRLTLRQMRSWLMADDARKAIEVAAGATEATYERLALILFGVELPQMLGKQAVVPQSPGMSAEERLELQREKARIRARLRRAAAKAARES
jgi:hypothetical protein